MPEDDLTFLLVESIWVVELEVRNHTVSRHEWMARFPDGPLVLVERVRLFGGTVSVRDYRMSVRDYRKETIDLR